MGFISNQWLTAVMNAAPWYPVEVTFEPEDSDDEWSKENKISAAFTAKRYNGHHQIVLFTQQGLHGILPHLLSGADAKTKRAVAQSIMNTLSDTAMLSLLSAVFHERSEKIRSRAKQTK